MKNRLSLTLLIFSFLFLSCSSTYRICKNSTIGYDQLVINENNVSLLHSEQNYFELCGNEKQLRKANRNELWLIPVRVINVSDVDCCLSINDIEVFNDYESTAILPFSYYYPKLRYRTLSNLAWFAGGLLGGVQVSNRGSDYTLINPFIVLFIPGTYYINRAIRSNKALEQDLLSTDIFDKNIVAGTSIDGFICIKAENINNPLIRFTND